MKILIASSEVHPYSKTGGLADMVGALAKSLARAGLQVDCVTPLHRGIREKFPDIHPFDWRMDLPLGVDLVSARLFKRDWIPGLTVYFVDQPAFFQRDALYQEAGVDYPDNAERFIFFSKCIVHLARYLPSQPELIHLHDWQVALVPLLVKHQRETEGWGSAPATCLTIHNLAYQGVFPRSAYDLTNLPDKYFSPDGVEFYGRLNCLKAGICYADAITTVSPRYAREITTETFGCGLDGVLRKRQRSLVGILNGVDYSEWNTDKNPHLRNHFTVRDLQGKDAEKLSLQMDLGLPHAARTPLFGSITRLVDQKGSDILLAALEEMLSADMQFVLLGSGSPILEKAFQDLARRHRGKVAVKIGYDHALSHRIEAASDFYLMPSRFEPCGLNQMYSLRYGTIPVVRTTGGLDDSVIDLTEDLERANGIKFYGYSSRALAKAIRKALALYDAQELFRRIQTNGMSVDFSWQRTSEEYVAVYHQALEAEKKNGSHPTLEK
ncbi:MAG TPA: glycogen synthase GlgA [Candidatus Angelobacter sp.]|nr:glycogen synthase GlgA [Candidatus Angelobacter sp.]